MAQAKDENDPDAAARDTRAAVAEAAQDAQRLGDAQPGEQGARLQALAAEAEDAADVSDADIARDPDDAKRELDDTLADLADASSQAAETDGARTGSQTDDASA